MIKIFQLFLILIVLLLSSLISLRAQGNVQRKQLFDDDWKFYLGDAPTASANDYVDKSWRELDLPHDWSIEGKVDPKNPMGSAGGFFPAGVGWYRKKFQVPLTWKGKHVSVYFEGVYMNSEVFINGKSLGVHPYGFTGFSYDLTPYLNFTKENVIAVRVDNSQQINCRWYTGSGIYRHVWMIITDPIHIATWGLAITTPEVSSVKATVVIKTRIQNETDIPQRIIVSTLVTDKKLKSVGDNTIKVELQANSEKEIEQIITVSKPLLWTPETPHLYQAQMQLVRGNTM